MRRCNPRLARSRTYDDGIELRRATDRDDDLTNNFSNLGERTFSTSGTRF